MLVTIMVADNMNYVYNLGELLGKHKLELVSSGVKDKTTSTAVRAKESCPQTKKAKLRFCLHSTDEDILCRKNLEEVYIYIVLTSDERNYVAKPFYKFMSC